MHDSCRVWPYATRWQSIPFTILSGHKPRIFLFYIRLSEKALCFAKGVPQEIRLLSPYTLFNIHCGLLSLLDRKDLHRTRGHAIILWVSVTYHRNLSRTTWLQFLLSTQWRYVVSDLPLYHALDNGYLQSPKEWKGVDAWYFYHRHVFIWPQQICSLRPLPSLSWLSALYPLLLPRKYVTSIRLSKRNQLQKRFPHWHLHPLT